MASSSGSIVLSGEQGNLVRLRWNQALSGARGPYGYYQVRSNEPYPKLGFITEGDVSVNNYGLFIQDAWTLNNKLTLNLGLRGDGFTQVCPATAGAPASPAWL